MSLSVKTLDRYIIREAIPPFLLALGMFTFLLAVKPALAHAQQLLSKGVDLPTTGFLLLTLLPQALGVTIPMAFMAGLLMALGRLSGDRESVALLACGVSPMRILRPVLLLAVIAGAVDLYTLTRLVPDSNQRFRVETLRLLVQKGESEIKPGVFYEGFPGLVIYVHDDRAGGGWNGVMLADTGQPGRPVVTMASMGFMEVDEPNRQVAIVLPGESVQYVPGNEPGVYDMARRQDLRFKISADAVFGSGDMMPARGLPEMTIAGLRVEEAKKIANNLSPHQEIMQRHQMFSFPVACLVFAVVGLAFGLHTRKEGKLGGFTLGILVISVYYAVMAVCQNLVKGGSFPAEWARWMPNIIVGAAGIVALWWRSRTRGGDIAITLPSWIRWGRGPVPDGVEAVAGTPRARTVVVIRLPVIELPRPRLLDLYVAGRYLRMVALSFFGLLALYYIGTLIDKSERLFKGQTDVWTLGEFFLYSTPQFIAHIVPMATLVAVLGTIGGLTRTSEMTVMRACGISLYRAAAPLLVLALVWSGGLFFLNDRVLARANDHAQVLEDQIRGSAPRVAGSISGANWLADARGRVYYYDTFEIRRSTLYGLSVFETARDPFRLASHTLASRAVYQPDGRWRAEDGWVQQFPRIDRAVRQNFRTRELDLADPSQFSGLHNEGADMMTFGELRSHIAAQAQSGFSLAKPRVDLQERIAFPLVTVVMTLLGIPFGVTTGRRGALYGIGLAMILGASYWLLSTFFLAVGQAELLPAVLAAWAANILFLAAAAYLTLTART